MQREHRTLEAAGFAAIALAGLAITVAAVVLGLVVMLSK